MSQITHKDIAEKLNVSRVTVTRALLDDPQISDQTRIKIKSLADELGYVPNFIGRNLALKRSQLIGLSLPKVDHSFFSTVTEVIYKSCIEAGFGVIPMISFENHANEVENLKTLLSMRVDGIIANIAYDTKDTEIYELVQSRNVPIVFFDRIIDNEAFGSISIHDEDASYQAVSYAIQCGYKKFAHIAGFSQINIGHDRSKGFKKALHEANLPIRDEWIIEGGFDKSDGYQGAMKLFEHDEKPDFIFAINDIVAYGVYEAAQEKNIKIPDQLGVIGFGDLELGQLLTPKLTTVHMPTQEIAQKAVELLMSKIENPNSKTERCKLKTDLIVRESCAMR